MCAHTHTHTATLLPYLLLDCSVLQRCTEHVCTPEGKEHLLAQWLRLWVKQQKMQPDVALKTPENIF